MSESPERSESPVERTPTPEPEETSHPSPDPEQTSRTSTEPEETSHPSPDLSDNLEQLEPLQSPSPGTQSEEARSVPSKPTHLFPSPHDSVSTPVQEEARVVSEEDTNTQDATANTTAADEPTSPVTTPTSPVTTPTSPVTTPTSPVTTPTSPVTTPTSPVTTPTSPVTTPTSKPEEKARRAEERGDLPRLGDVGTPSLFAEQITSGVTFEMYYLGTTKLNSPANPSKSQHLQLCREVLSRIKMPQGEIQPLTPISVFISTRTLQLLDPTNGKAMIQHLLPSISYISDVGNNLVIMAKNDSGSENGMDGSENGEEREGDQAATPDSPTTNKISLVCHLLESRNAHNVAVTMGHAFNVAYRQFLRSSGINEDQLAVAEYSTVLSAQKMSTEHLDSLTDRENHRSVMLEKRAGEPIGLMLIESGWGSMLPTCVVGHMAKSGPAVLSNKINIGDHVIRLCGQSLVGIPLDKSIEMARNARSLTKVSMELASCNPVVEVNIIRPDVKFPLGFTVQDGDIVSLSRGSISDRSGIRVGHKIIEINGQSTINMKHDQIVTLLKTSIGELLLKTMPIHLFKLTLGLDQPLYV